MKRAILYLFIFSFAFFSQAQIFNSTEVDSIFDSWNNYESPGAALGIVRNGELVYSKGYGYGDLEHDLPLTPTSVFYIGSVSKQFVTFCVLLLEEQGKLKLDDPIQKYLPGFPEYESPLTIRHFIHHTSGVRDYLTLMALKGRSYLDHITVPEVYDLIKRQKVLNFPPGEKQLYSNSCYFMLAMIIEKVAGKTIREFAKEEMFDPLGMKNTQFYDDNTMLIKNKVFSYEKDEGEKEFKNLIMRFDLVGSGGVYSTIEDLYLWDQNFYNNKLGKGGQDIIDKMHEEGTLNNGESAGYAFALNNGAYKGLRTVSHGGALAGYRAQLMRFPDEEVSVIILANRSDANPTRKSFEVADVILKDKLKEEPKEEKEDVKINAPVAKAFTLKKMIGTYQIQPNVNVKISIKNDSLHVEQKWNNVSYNIAKSEGNKFHIPSNTNVQFIFSELKNDQTQILTVIQNGSSTKCNRIEEIDRSTIDLLKYVGSFYSEEIDASYKLFIEDDTLIAKLPNSEAEKLEISNQDTFTLNGIVLRFNISGKSVDGFELDAGRVTNLSFKKIN